MIKSYLDAIKSSTTPFIDELALPNGKISPHWQKLANAYEKMGLSKMNQHYGEVAQQLRENGVTYNIHGDPDGMNRPWNLDPIPMMISAEDWAIVEAGLIQRARLLNYVLSDIYGNRSLITNGLLPFELIYNHRGFLRAADKIKLEGPHQLILSSCDLARGPNGKMWVLHDRVDAPSGAGYTFENRSAMTRIFPELIRENQVRKISNYYQILKNTLINLSYKNKENPRIVLLSPGPLNETYFEHAYVASLLGFTLALGGDLTVSDGYVWLKTIKGLEKVDVIIRRVDDVYCDPLYFRNDSHLGVVGLMEAVRQKKVTVINPLGSRILENPGLLAFLPGICRHLLDEELILPSVATWWCGQKEAKEYVLSRVHELVIRNIYRSNEAPSIYGGELSKMELERLKAKIKAHPYMYVGQERVNYSTTPSLINGKLSARNSIFRSYTVADSETQGYYVMPGGLSRSSAKEGVFLISNQTGGISKDTWVLGKKSDSVEPKSGIKPNLIKVETVLPSRTGEHLFWQGRYLERAANTVRLVRMALKTYNEMDDSVAIEKDVVLSTLLKTLTELTFSHPGFFAPKNLEDPEKELKGLVIDSTKLGSIAQSIQAFLANSYAVRDRLSLDTWRILDTISEEVQSMNKEDVSLQDIYHGLDNLIIKLMAFAGLNLDNMTREPTWSLLNIGRFVESATNNCVILKSMLGQSFDTEDKNKTIMEYTLRCSESLVTYRYQYRSTLMLEGILNLLLLDETNPRSLVFQISSIDAHIQEIPQIGISVGLSAVRKTLLTALTKVRLCEVKTLVELDKESDEYSNLVEFLSEIIELLNEVSNKIFETYFGQKGDKYRVMSQSRLLEI